MQMRFHKYAGFLALLGGLLLLIPLIGIILNSDETIDDWFVVPELSVPDHSINDNPKITFNRIILRRLSGQWSTETQRKDGPEWVTICRGTGLSNYSPDEALPKQGVTLDWFRGDCDEQAGIHRLQVVWQFTDPETGETKSRIAETENYTVTK